MNLDIDAAIDRDFSAAQRGDRAAFARLVATTQRMVTGIALAVTADVAQSEDVAQETFFAAWRRLALMRNPASFLPWLRQVARRRALDHVRTGRYREDTSDHWDELVAQLAESRPGPAEALSAREDAALLAQALDEIPADSREVLLLFYREGQDGRSVAALLGLTEAAVRKRLQRARASLNAEFLQRAGLAAERSAPGVAFTGAVVAGLSLQPSPAAAAGAGLLAKFGPKALLGAFGGLFASIGLVVGAVYFETRSHLRKLRDPDDRRAMRRNGYVYGALMATYMVVLWRASDAAWEREELLGAAVAFSLGIFALAWSRMRIVGRRRREDGP